MNMYPVNASEFCVNGGGVGDGFAVAAASAGTWREKKFDVTSDSDDNDVDDGYSKSDASNNSYHSTHETLTNETANSASSTSGVSTNRQSENGGRSGSSSGENGHTGHNHETVNKILISREINDAIFKPDYRFSFKCNGPPKYWHQQDHLDIDLLSEHTKSQNIDDDDNEVIMSKWNAICSKILIRATLDKGIASTDDAIVNVHIQNAHLKYPITLIHLLWINLYEHKIVTMNQNGFAEPITLVSSESTNVRVPAKEFDLSKDYKLVIYYGPFELLFSKEFILKVTTRPISTMYMEKLDHYFPEPAIRQLDRCHYKVPEQYEHRNELMALKEKIITYERSEAATRLNSTNYYSMCKLMLQMEDETDSKRSLRHDQHQQRVQHEFGHRYSLKISNKRLEAAINEYTRIWITPMSIRLTELKLNNMRSHPSRTQNRNATQHTQHSLRSKKERIYGSVVEIKGNMVYLELNESLDRFHSKTGIHPSNEEYFIRFMSDRTTITLEHRSLEYLNNQRISRFFFPTIGGDGASTPNKVHPSSYTNQEIEWNAMDLNNEQKSAIVNILKQTSYPYPMLLFGPPGTGKTKTLIEAIMQIIHNDNPNEFILVCATSNSACNEVAVRLLANIGSDKLFRIFAKSVSFNMADIPAVLLAASNLQKGEHYYPSLQVIYQYKVIVCTLTTAGRLSQGKINPKHFSHVFIDEAGSATETQTLIAVAGLCSTNDGIHANLVLAGDPKQLGPLIKSQQAIKMGYGVSMLERLITTNPLYMRSDATKQFNRNYVTQLVCNYRSHTSILHSSNHLYYDGALQVCAPRANTDWFLNTSLLCVAQFPMIFHSVKGITMRDHSNPSSYNRQEIDVTMDYLRRIFKSTHRSIIQNDVGIISPYRRQCEQLTEQCARNGFTGIQIGSVEIFQGQEKPIIIVSTVRSQMDNIGFLNSKKRLNVLLTRAKCLLIIIGDADTLAKDDDWNYVIKFCKANHSIIE